MGNTVTTATTVFATEQSSSKTKSSIHQHVHQSMEGTPPPECPMHKPADLKEKQQAPKSECPIDHTNQNDINPLNMVNIFSY